MLVLNATIDYILSSERFAESLFNMQFFNFFRILLGLSYLSVFSFYIIIFKKFFLLFLNCTRRQLRFLVPVDCDCLFDSVILYIKTTP